MFCDVSNDALLFIYIFVLYVLNDEVFIYLLSIYAVILLCTATWRDPISPAICLGQVQRTIFAVNARRSFNEPENCDVPSISL